MSLRKLLFFNLIALSVIYIVLLSLKQPQSTGSGLGGRAAGTQYFNREPRLINNLKVSELDLSNKTLAEALNLIEKYKDKRTYVNLPHRSFVVTYRDLGVRFNLETLSNFLNKCHPLSLSCEQEEPEIKLKDALVSLDQDKFKKFVDNLNESVKTLLLSSDISFDEGTFRAYNSDSEIRIDADALYSQLTPEVIFSEKDITISTIVYSKNPERQKQLTQELIEKAVSLPLLIKYGRQPVNIENNILKGFINLEESTLESTARVSRTAIGEYLESLKEKYPVKVELEKEASISIVEYALLFRVGGEDPKTAVILPLQGGPSTDGKYAQKYLEVNKTQQRLYAFENGGLKKTYIIGTGLTWETPAGEFKILKKSGTAISYTGGWYMPYYMPIGTVYGYFFGFHEIPYRINAQGQITARDINTMGSPATGGCIQLYRNDAKELYEWADIGTPVLIRD